MSGYGSTDWVQNTLIPSLKKASISVLSNDPYSISTDQDAATVFVGIEQDNVPAFGWQIEAALGGIRNIRGRTLVGNFGVMSLHLVSTNNAAVVIHIFSEMSIDNGVTWTKNGDSGRQEVTAGNQEAYTSKSSQFFSVPDQAIVRFRAFADGANLSANPISFLADGDTVTGPSFRLWLTEA